MDLFEFSLDQMDQTEAVEELKQKKSWKRGNLRGWANWRKTGKGGWLEFLMETEERGQVRLKRQTHCWKR